MEAPLVDFAPIARLAIMAALLALLPLSWVWLRRRGADTRGRLAALTALTLFLTFDLIVFGSFTRLSDSGLGCPDWPGCYGKASPLGAHADIQAAQTAMPTGPVTFSKAWIEMIHRYLAMTVGVLIMVMAAVSWLERRRLPHSPWWATLTLVWVVVQGLFGKYTVTLKLYPAIVTLHLLGGLLLLAMLAVQHEAFRDRALSLGAGSRRLVMAALAALGLQIALGGWVSTNYAVLACTDFPRCNGQWLPPMDFANGFTVLRELGQTASGSFLPFEALVAVHMVHRWFAVVAAAVVVWLALRLLRDADAAVRRYGWGLIALLVAQLASGLSNVVLGWPLAAALAHSAGAAAFVLVLTSLLARSASRRTVQRSSAGRAAWAA
jgi:heme a synthase